MAEVLIRETSQTQLQGRVRTASPVTWVARLWACMMDFSHMTVLLHEGVHTLVGKDTQRTSALVEGEDKSSNVCMKGSVKPTKTCFSAPVPCP